MRRLGLIALLSTVGTGCSTVGQKGEVAAAPADHRESRDPLPTTLEEVEHRVRKGELSLALRGVEAILEKRPGDVEAVELRDSILDEVRVLITALLKRSERAIDDHNYALANDWLDSAETFPLSVSEKFALKELRQRAEHDEAEARASLEQADMAFRAAVADGRAQAAHEVIQANIERAKALEPKLAEEWQKVALVFEVRVETALARERARQRRMAEAAARSRIDVVDAMFNKAARHEKAGRLYEAILAYEQVLSQKREYGAAKSALSRLEPKRQLLVEQYLQAAESHFLNQELDQAVPYYRKVARLDKSNKRAQAGLKMYENLVRLSGRRAATK